MTEPRPGFTAVGVVRRAHGVRGELRVDTFSLLAPNLQGGCVVYVRGEPHRVLGSRRSGDSWLVTLDGVASRAAADGLKGELLEAADASLRRDDPESYFVYELVGLRVVTDDGRDVGAIAEVLTTTANDVYVVRGEGAEVLIPAIGEVVREVDLAGGMVRITPMAGLLDESK